jgi:hypothetical protein
MEGVQVTDLPLRVEFHFYVHFPDPIRIQMIQASGPAKRAILKLGGSNMPGTIDVDTQNETVTLAFVDDKGNVTDPQDGVTVNFDSDDEGIAIAAIDPANPLVANITPVAPGDCTLGATVTGATEPDGTPMPSPDRVPLHVNPGAAVGERLTVGPN